MSYVGNCIVMNNNVTANKYDGIRLFYFSSGNTVSANNLAKSHVGIDLEECFSNTFYANNIIASDYGITFDYSADGNTFFTNNLANNSIDIKIWDGSKNMFYHNNFIDNARQVYTDYSTNVWDDGYSSGGNYWSDYDETDLFSGPYQSETGSDGIGDKPYVIDADNRDNYPLMNPWTPIRRDVNSDGIARAQWIP